MYRLLCLRGPLPANQPRFQPQIRHTSQVAILRWHQLEFLQGRHLRRHQAVQAHNRAESRPVSRRRSLQTSRLVILRVLLRNLRINRHEFLVGFRLLFHLKIQRFVRQHFQLVCPAQFPQLYLPQLLLLSHLLNHLVSHPATRHRFQRLTPANSRQEYHLECPLLPRAALLHPYRLLFLLPCHPLYLLEYLRRSPQ